MILPVRSSGSGSQLGLKMRGSTEITPIPGTERGRSVVYSPDGQWIAYIVGQELFKRTLIGGSPVRLAGDADPSIAGVAWLDDWTILYERSIGDPRTIAQISEEGGEPIAVLEVPAPLWLHGLPDAQGALMVACPGVGICGLGRSNLYVVDLRDLSSELILEQVGKAWYTPTGHIVYLQTDGALFAVPFDLGTLSITGSAIPLFDRVRTWGSGADIMLAADGTLLYVESAVGRTDLPSLVVVDLEANEEELDLAPRGISSVGWSPDGQSVVFWGGAVIYTYNVELGTTPRSITCEGENTRPVFSPDGSDLTP